MRQNTKTIIGLNSTVTTTASTFTAEIDCAGFNFGKFIFFAATTEASPTTGYSIVESDTSGGTTNSITGYTQNTDWTAATATSATSVAKMIYAVDLRGRKRYIKLTSAVTTGLAQTAVNWVAELSNPGDGVGTATEAGSASVIGI